MPHFPAATDRDREIDDVSDFVLPSSVSSDFATSAASYVKINAQIREMEAEKKRLRDILVKYVGEYGYDSNGNQALDLENPVNGVSTIVRQRRTRKMPLDQEAATRILSEHGIYDRCTIEVHELDGDEILACLAEGILSDAELEEILPVKEEFALVAKK